VFPAVSRAVAAIDAVILTALTLLAWWFLISGLDDLVIDALYPRLFTRPRREPPPIDREKVLAVMIPAWQEEAVIARMLDYNGRNIRYANYEFFVGAYPNDAGTVAAVQAFAAIQMNVHLCLTPHPGPTSKADCLNWIYQHLLVHEELTGRKFDAIVLHDSEDLIHPHSFQEINRYLEEFDMVQVPVIPLATP
jgi:adsorption protein B